MTSIRKAALACAIATVAMLPLAAAAQTGPRNQDTFFTFSQAVELPGTTLPAGTYLFMLADSPSNRHVVRVMSQDRQKLHTTLMAIPSYSLDRPSEDPQVRFMEGPETGPQAVKVWFYPGRSVGHEFIYPRSQAMRLAQRTGESVLTTKTETQVAEVSEQDIVRVDRTGTDAAADVNAQNNGSGTARMQTGSTEATTTTAEARPMEQPTPARTEAPTRTAAASAQQPVSAPEPARTAPVAAEREQLPNTASLLPLLALVGVGSLIGSRWLRRSRKVQP